MAEGKSGLTEEEQTEGMVAALNRERAAYLRTGNPERATQVEEQIKLRGGKVVDPEDRESGKDPKTEAPQGRSAKPQQTAAKKD